LKERGSLQISMNLVKHVGNPGHRVFALIRDERSATGVPIVGSEVVGDLVCQDAP